MNRLQHALAQAGHGIVEEWVNAPKHKTDPAELAELTRPQPTWAETEAESRRKRKAQLEQELQEAEAALPRVREELPVKEKEYADKLKNAKSNEHAILHPEEFAIEMKGLKEYISRLQLALKLPGKIRQRLATLEATETGATLALLEAWRQCDPAERMLFLKRLGVREFDNAALARPMSTEAV